MDHEGTCATRQAYPLLKSIENVRRIHDPIVGVGAKPVGDILVVPCLLNALPLGREIQDTQDLSRKLP